MRRLTKYFGFITVAISWISLFSFGAIQSPDWSEPVSQFGFYDSTRLLFGVTITITAVTWYLFSKHLDAYWKHTSQITLAAGMFLSVAGWIPYQPYAQNFVFDVHNLAITLAAILYVMPLWFIAYKKSHQQIARVSHLLFFITLTLIGLNIIARLLNFNIAYMQLLGFTPAYIWLIVTNTLLLQHHAKITAGHTGKL